MHPKPLTIALAASLLLISPALPVFDSTDGAAHARDDRDDRNEGGGNGNDGGGGGNGNGGGNGGGGGNGNGNAAGAAEARVKPAKATSVAAADGLSPRELGKMNGAMNASINAVLAHIRNGQTSKGPVGALAGLAVADTTAAAAMADATGIGERAAGFAALSTAVATAGFASTEDYLAARQAGTVTAEQMTAIDPLVEAVGGADSTGLALSETPPTAAEIADAQAAALAAEAAVAAAEVVIADAWNRDGDLALLLAGLRDRLVPHQDAITAQVAATGTD